MQVREPVCKERFYLAEIAATPQLAEELRSELLRSN